MWVRPLAEHLIVLRDDDYKRKAAGGKWVILYEQEVGNISDKEIHPFLKSHPRVKHDKSSDNTEEFLFIDDPGDGSEAIRIVSEDPNFAMPSAFEGREREASL